MGTFLAYVGARGHTLRDRELYLPEARTQEPARLQAVGLTPDTPFATKPQLARRMLERVLETGPPVAWVTGDAVYGHARGLRSWQEEQGLHHVLAVPRNEELWAGTDLRRVDRGAGAGQTQSRGARVNRGGEGPFRGVGRDQWRQNKFTVDWICFSIKHHFGDQSRAVCPSIGAQARLYCLAGGWRSPAQGP